ncbi:hypothetical protein EV363DRAFT_1328034 [Boletus edulis]|nr:hypothetical protein EV363DRAFT_1328034 [Boletus edulis]
MAIAIGAALITGSAQNIGRSIALRFLRDGFDIALDDVPSKSDQLSAVASEIQKIGRRTRSVLVDVTIEELKEMAQGAAEGLGGWMSW